MAILFSQTMPEGASVEVLDAVTEEMGVDADPPAGMIVHVHFEEAGRVRIVDVWESAQAHATFVEERLAPAMAKVAAAHGMDLAQMGEPVTSVTEVHRMVRGR